MIVLEKVFKRYQMGETVVTALNGVSLRIKPGEFVSLMGASGSGKSTLLNMIGLLDRPESGILRISGRETSSLSDDEISRLRSEMIGFVFQQFNLLNRTTALDNVRLPLIYAKGTRPSADPEELLARVGLEERCGHKPNELSGGQQQRVAIARALIRRPSLVLADEPTGNLDSHSGAEIIRLLRELHAEGLTVILVTHEPSIAAEADRTLRMLDGQIVEDIWKSRTTPVLGMEPITQTHLQSAKQWKLWKLLLLNFQQALRGLRANKLRTGLSALGIIVGVAAVIIMMALGHATQRDVAHYIENSGANRIVIIPNYQNIAGVRQKPGAVSRLTVDEAMSIAGRLPSVTAVSGNVHGNVQVVYGHNNVNTTLYGTMPGYMNIYNQKPEFGRFFNMQECLARSRVALIGATVLEGLFGETNPIGQTIKINGIPCTVIGFLPARGTDISGNDADDCVLVPLQTAMYRILGRNYVDWIDLAATSAQEVEATEQQALEMTHEWPQIPGVIGESYRTFTMKALLSTVTQTMLAISLLLGGVTGISLIVGGIGIMNIMLVSVRERTREIGLRKALGARNRDIQAQFLIESVTLCFSGGCIGILVGWLISWLIALIKGGVMNPTLFSIFLASGISVAVGVAFGYWPAVLASRLNPIEALHHE